MKSFRRHEIFELAAGTFLCEPLPTDWDDLDQDAQEAFVQDNAWHPLEFMHPEELIKNIQISAEAIEEFLREHGVEVVE